MLRWTLPGVLVAVLLAKTGTAAFHDDNRQPRPVSRAPLGASPPEEAADSATGLSPASELSRLLRREAPHGSRRHGLQIGIRRDSDSQPASALQVQVRESPFILAASHWSHSVNVTFQNTHTDIPQGGWIESKAELERPTIVEAEIRSSRNSGPVGMALFAEEHSLESSLYAITTGYGMWHDEAMSSPGDERITAGFNNVEDTWALVKFVLELETITIFINDNVIHNSSNTAKSKGRVQFVAESEPMQVRGVRWRRDCEFTAWENEGLCSVSCGHGTQRSTRVQLAPALFGGSCKGGIERMVKCYKGPCEGFDMR